MDWVDRFAGSGPNSFPTQRKVIRSVIENPQSNWYQLIVRVLKETDKEVVKTVFTNFFMNANLVGWKTQEEYREKYGCNIPWAILLDPTSACNLHCTGCWAAEYGNRLNLSFQEMDSIIQQGKEMGVYMYIYTGGEPLVRKKDLIVLCEKHSDCVFLSFTNATLIDEAFAKEMLRVKNFIPAISVEGSQESHDSRRGSGSYGKVVRAMNLLKENRLPFGISCCYTSQNFESISSEAFYDQMIDWGASFVWYFHYMPVGNDAAPELLPTPEQREFMYHQIRHFRETKAIFGMDFQMTESMWAAVSPEDAGICTSMPTAMWTPVCSSTIPTATSGKKHCWSASSRPSSWLITRGSPLMTTCCAPAPCWRTRRSCGKWSPIPVPTPPICSLPRARSICVPNATPTPKTGPAPRTGCGNAAASARRRSRRKQPVF